MYQKVSQRMLKPAAVVSVLLWIASGCVCTADGQKQAFTRTYEITAFKGISVPGSKTGMTVDVFVSDDLARTPRHYLRVGATVKAAGESEVAIILVDVLKREYRGPMVKLTPGKETQISVDVEKIAGRPVSMLRGVRLFHKSKADRPMDAPGILPPGARLFDNRMVRVSALCITCADELVPKPDATVTGPLDETSIQKALDSLGPKGGVVYIPAGRYIFKSTVRIPADNITVYGDGRATILEGTWMKARAVIFAAGRKNLRFTRLHFKSLPITARRGYQGTGREAKYAEPGAEGKISVTSRGLHILDCRNVRVDHCEFELFGHFGVGFYGGMIYVVDHCFFHENFRYGYGYGISTVATKELYIEDNNFENHRHGIAGNSKRASYVARFNRMVKDAALTEAWKQPKGESFYTARGQLRLHEIDAHKGCGWIYAHDNYVSMRNGVMSCGASMRGDVSAWLYRNVFENCHAGVSAALKPSDVVCAWRNKYVNCKKGAAYYGVKSGFRDSKPADFKEFPYPSKHIRDIRWPGASGKVAFVKPKFDSLCAGPAKPALLREVDVPTGRGE